TFAAVKLFTPPKRLIAIAKHPTQRDLARKLGADQVVSPADVFQRVRFATAARRLEGMNRPLLLGGSDITFECVGRADSLNDAVRFTRQGGTVVVVGMPGEEKVDWAPIWQRELTVTGAYAYGTEPKRKGRKTFELALEAAPEMHLDELTGPLFRLGMKMTIAFDDLSLPLPPMAAPDVRQLVMEEVIDMAAEAGIDDLHIIAALGLHRRMTEDEVRHIVGERIFTTFHPDRLYQ